MYNECNSLTTQKSDQSVGIVAKEDIKLPPQTAITRQRRNSHWEKVRKRAVSGDLPVV